MPDDVRALERQLSAANCVRSDADGRRVHLVRWEGQVLWAGAKWVKGDLVLCTFLPPDTLDARRRKAVRLASGTSRGPIARNRRLYRVKLRKLARGEEA